MASTLIAMSSEELGTLKSALDRVLLLMENELVHTEAPSLQHALNADFERVRRLRQRFDEPSATGG